MSECVPLTMSKLPGVEFKYGVNSSQDFNTPFQSLAFEVAVQMSDAIFGF